MPQPESPSPSPITDALLGDCPPPLRPEAKRALELRLKRAVAEIGFCVACAHEIDLPVTTLVAEDCR